MSQHQTGILCPIPNSALYLELKILPDVDLADLLGRLGTLKVANRLVVGFGQPLIERLDITIEGLRSFENLKGADNVSVPGTQADLFIQTRANTPAEAEAIEADVLGLLDGTFAIERRTPAFLFAGGRDLTGYEDGTENPEDEEALETALMEDSDTGLNGGSFLALQKWRHELEKFRSFTTDEQDAIIGRRISDNSEIDEAPPSAHRVRTDQEDFDPRALIFRRSMPWSFGGEEGLMLTSYSATLRPFDVQLNRMLGLDDGITDALFKFTTAQSGAFYWCPPVENERVALGALSTNL